jgi:phenylacetic acid degradation operon negative regulatory protein
LAPHTKKRLFNTASIDNLIANYKARRSLRATSLIMSVYGDAVVPRGGTLWLGSLIRLLAPIGLNERLVRTSVYRLSRDGWLSSQQIGRRSYYSLTHAGWRSFERAYNQVYHTPHFDWDGQWTLALLMEVDAGRRGLLRKELGYLGFGSFGAEVLAHPRPPGSALASALEDLGVWDQVVLMRAHSDHLPSMRPLNRLVRDCWQLDTLAAEYEAFLAWFQPIWQELQNSEEAFDPADCLAIRILLIHTIRRLLLRDPRLPAAVLPENWPGEAAQQLCRTLYRAVQPAAERHLTRMLETAEGPLPDPAPYFYDRFGGLPQPTA